jgi:hypothetical protein
LGDTGRVCSRSHERRPTLLASPPEVLRARVQLHECASPRTCFPSRSRAALQCLDRFESGAAHWVHRVLLQPWSSRTWLLESPLASRRRCPNRAPRPSTLGLPTFHRVLPGFPGHRERPRDRSCRYLPSPGVSLPYSDRDCKGTVFPGVSRAPAPCVFRLRTSLDAFLPFAASNPFRLGRSWDSPFRAFLLATRRWFLSDHRTLLTLLVPTPPR